MVATTKSSKKHTSLKYVGNNKLIKLNENNNDLKVIGNNCYVDVIKNDGLIKIIGDNFLLNLNNGTGNICVVGNNGVVNLGYCSLDKCNFVGKNITINGTDGTSQTVSKNCNVLNVTSQENLHIC